MAEKFDIEKPSKRIANLFRAERYARKVWESKCNKTNTRADGAAWEVEWKKQQQNTVTLWTAEQFKNYRKK